MQNGYPNPFYCGKRHWERIASLALARDIACLRSCLKIPAEQLIITCHNMTLSSHVLKSILTENLESFIFLKSRDKTGLQSVFIVLKPCDLLITSSCLLCGSILDTDKMFSRARNLRRSQSYFSSHLSLS